MSEITPVTHLEKTIAGEVQPVTHLEHVIAEYGGGGGGGGFTPTTAQLAAMNSGITSEDVEQISTNENNILKLMPTAYTTPRINTDYGLTLVWGGYAKVGNLCVVNMRLSCTSDIPAGTFLAFDLPKAISTTGLSTGSIFCSLTNSLGLNIAVITDFDTNKSNIANNVASGTIPTGNIILSGIYLCETE